MLRSIDRSRSYSSAAFGCVQAGDGIRHELKMRRRLENRERSSCIGVSQPGFLMPQSVRYRTPPRYLRLRYGGGQACWGAADQVTPAAAQTAGRSAPDHAPGQADSYGCAVHVSTEAPSVASSTSIEPPAGTSVRGVGPSSGPPPRWTSTRMAHSVCSVVFTT